MTGLGFLKRGNQEAHEGRSCEEEASLAVQTWILEMLEIGISAKKSYRHEVELVQERSALGNRGLDTQALWDLDVRPHVELSLGHRLCLPSWAFRMGVLTLALCLPVFTFSDFTGLLIRQPKSRKGLRTWQHWDC